MLVKYFSVWASSILSVAAASWGPTSTAPTLIGPIYVPSSNSSSQGFLNAASEAYAAITEAINTGISEYGALDNLTTSFSVAVFSATTNDTLFEYHFEAPKLAGSYTKGRLTESTIYRSGSLGKLLFMYNFLVDIGDGVFLDPVTKYIPELQEAVKSLPSDPLRYVNWEEVTVGSLATQLSGIGRNYLFGDFALSGFELPPVETFIELGYPYVTAADLPTCTFYGSNLPTCSRKQFFQGLARHPPAFQSYSKPMYSNLNFALLGLVYESITGHSLESGWDNLYQKKLKMTSTTYSYPGADADAIIPYNDTFAKFAYDIGLLTPAGGQYVNLKDLATLGRAILQSSHMPKVDTRRWFTHAASTALWTSNVGTPFEIYRLPVVVDTDYNLSRLVNIYSKAGDVGQYSTTFGIVPDHQIGYSVLAAGVNPGVQALAIRDIVVDKFVNGAEEAAKAQARVAFPGSFKAGDINSSLTLAVDGGPGVAITGWVSNGTDFLLNNAILPTANLRLYPTDLVRTDGGSTYRAYRLLFAGGRKPATAGLWPAGNENWFSIDSGIYNNQPFDAFIAAFDKDGVVQSIYSEGLVVNLTRSDA